MWQLSYTTASQGVNEEDTGTTERIWWGTNLALPFGGFKGDTFIGEVARGQGRKGDVGKGLHCGTWEGELTIGHTRGEVLSLIVSAPGHVTGTLSDGLRRLALQHVDYVHAVDALQSCVQALHCGGDA